MLESLEITNFQQHAKLSIEFDPGITTITGETGRGKSSILRALKWLVLNRPDGDRFIRWGADTSRVRLVVNGVEITRQRGAGSNSYCLNRKERYVAFKRFEVPETISKLLNMGEENFQGQFSDPFWLTKTGGELSKELNHIISLDLIDKTLENVTKLLRESRTIVQISQERLDQTEQRAHELEWIPGANEQLSTIENIGTEIRGLADISDLMKYLCEKAQSLGKKKILISKAISVGIKAASIAKDLSKTQTSQDKLELLYSKSVELGQKLCQVQKKKKEMERILVESLKKRCPVCGTSGRSPLSALIST